MQTRLCDASPWRYEWNSFALYNSTKSCLNSYRSRLPGGKKNRSFCEQLTDDTFQHCKEAKSVANDDENTEGAFSLSFRPSGSYVTREFIGRNYSVQALVRNPEKVASEGKNLEPETDGVVDHAASRCGSIAHERFIKKCPGKASDAIPCFFFFLEKPFRARPAAEHSSLRAKSPPTRLALSVRLKRVSA